MTIKPFAIAVPQATLDDLHERLARTRWPDEAADAGWSMGTNGGYLKQLVDYWVTETAGSSARMYLEDARAGWSGEGEPQPAARSEVPVGVALFPREAQFPRAWAERSLNVQHFATMPRADTSLRWKSQSCSSRSCGRSSVGIADADRTRALVQGAHTRAP